MGICGESDKRKKQREKENNNISSIIEGTKRSLENNTKNEKEINQTKNINEISLVKNEDSKNKLENEKNEENQEINNNLNKGMGICGEPDKRKKQSVKEKNNISGIIAGTKRNNCSENGVENKREIKQTNNINEISSVKNENSKNKIENEKNEENQEINNDYNTEKQEKNKNIERKIEIVNNNDEKEKIGYEENKSLESNSNISEIKSKYENINYDDLNIYNDYYLSCPQCKNLLPYIQKVEYDMEKNDFKVEYICSCNSSKNKKNEIYFRSLISVNEPINECQEHREKKLKLFCKDCQIKICEICKEEKHNDHEIDYNEILSKKNADKIFQIAREKKDIFKGFDILQKLLTKYKDNSKLYQNTPSNNANEKNSEDGINEENIIENLKESKNIKDIRPKKDIKIINNNDNENVAYKEEIKENKSYKEFIIEDDGHPRKEKNYNYRNHRIDNENIKEISPQNEKNKNPKEQNQAYIKDDDLDEIKNSKQKLRENQKIILSPESAVDKNIFDNNNDNKIPINSNNHNLANNNDYQDCMQYKCIKTLNGHKEKVVSLIELESGYLASGSYDNFIYIWDINTGNYINKKKENGYVFCLLEFESNMILSGTSDNNINLWDISNMEDKYIYSFKAHQLWVNCLVKIDSQFFASASNDANIIIWDYNRRAHIKFLQGHRDCILSLIKLNDDGHLCSGSADLTIKIWDWKKGICLITLSGHEKWVKCLCQLKDGTLLSGSDDKKIKVWKNNKMIYSIKEHTYSIRALCQIDENHFASGSFDKKIKIWDIKNFDCIQTLTEHTGNIISIIKLHDNKLASCSCDKTIKIWENN